MSRRCRPPSGRRNHSEPNSKSIPATLARSGTRCFASPECGWKAPPVERIGGMADVPATGPFRLVYLVYNTIFNLISPERQTDCFRNVTRVLEPDGAFVIECFVPDPSKFDRGQRVEALSVTEDSATIEVSRHDAAAQRYNKQTIRFSHEGIRLLPVALRYSWPSELDLMARLAGLRLRERYADWDRRPFGSTSTSHISVYRPA